jgi:membrane protease YdiL (CAAX protease family)
MGGIVSDLGRPTIRPVPWPLWAAGLALVTGAMFRAPMKPVSVVRVQVAYEIVLMAGVLAGAALVRARSTSSYRALLAGSSGGATRLGWIVIGAVSAWLTLFVLGTFLSAGDAKARDVAISLRGWVAVDGWVLILCVLAPLAEELLWRRALFTALACIAAKRLGERKAIVLAAALSSVMFAAWHLLGGDSAATLWGPTLLGMGAVPGVLADRVRARRGGGPRVQPPHDRIRDSRRSRAGDHAARAPGHDRGADRHHDHLVLASLEQSRPRATGMNRAQPGRDHSPGLPGLERQLSLGSEVKAHCRGLFFPHIVVCSTTRPAAKKRPGRDVRIREAVLASAPACILSG